MKDMITTFCKTHNLNYEEVESLCMMYAVGEKKQLLENIGAKCKEAFVDFF